MFPVLPLPTTATVGLKAPHFSDALAQMPRNGWFEVHAENYLMAGGPLLKGLSAIREKFQLSFHCVGMSPGSADGLDEVHVQRIKQLCERFQPALVSDHLSWSRWQQHSLNDLLPLPYSEAALTTISDNVDRIQTLLGRSIAIENPSVYFALPDGDMDEADFLVQLAQRSGCSILLDLNNLVVNATNVGLDAGRYLRRIPPLLVSEYHLAGHKVEQHASGALCIDDHGSAVSDRVWSLYAEALQVMTL